MSFHFEALRSGDVADLNLSKLKIISLVEGLLARMHTLGEQERYPGHSVIITPWQVRGHVRGKVRETLWLSHHAPDTASQTLHPNRRASLLNHIQEAIEEEVTDDRYATSTGLDMMETVSNLVSQFPTATREALHYRLEKEYLHNALVLLFKTLADGNYSACIRELEEILTVDTGNPEPELLKWQNQHACIASIIDLDTDIRLDHVEDVQLPASVSRVLLDSTMGLYSAKTTAALLHLARRFTKRDEIAA